MSLRAAEIKIILFMSVGLSVGETVGCSDGISDGGLETSSISEALGATSNFFEVLRIRLALWSAKRLSICVRPQILYPGMGIFAVLF